MGVLGILILVFFLYGILKFKSILLQLVLLVSFLPLITMVAFMNELPVPGVLFLQRNIFSDKTILTSFVLLALSNFILLVILFPLRKTVYSYKPFKCTDVSCYLLLGILFLSAVISYPRVFGFDSGIDMSTVYISTNIALFLCKNSRTSLCFLIHLFILLLVIIGGDRVDSIIAIVFLCVMGYDNFYIREKITRSYLVVGGVLLFVLSIVSGTARDGHSVSLESVFYSLYAQQTVSDILYVFLCSVEYYYNNGPDLSVWGNLLLGLFPGPFYGVVSEYNYTIFLIKNFMPNPGGGLFISEGMIAIGPLGTLLYMMVYAFCIRLLFISQKKNFIALFVLSIVMLCRIQWYGFIYAYKPIIFTVIFCLIFIYLQKQKSL